MHLFRVPLFSLALLVATTAAMPLGRSSVKGSMPQAPREAASCTAATMLA